MDAKNFLKQLFLDGLDICSPDRVVKKVLSISETTVTIGEKTIGLNDRPIYLLAVGKASYLMYKSAENILGDAVSGTLVIGPNKESAGKADNMIVGSHPTPDNHSVEAGKKAAEFFRHMPEHAVVITLISGGASSLMCLPAEGISVSDLTALFETLNHSGASIDEINTVRKHCSQIKGGHLLRFLPPSVTLFDLVISDVPNDDLSIIGSGPTIPDPSTFADAVQILQSYDLWDRIPQRVQHHLEQGAAGNIAETVKPSDDPLTEHYSNIISSAATLADVIADLASKSEWISSVAPAPFNGDVEIVAARIADDLTSFTESTAGNPGLFIYYGESSVSVTGGGKGGRNQELALRGAFKIRGQKNITWLSAGTDGIDGPTDAAGAIVDGQTIAKAEAKGLDPRKYLDNNDSYNFHDKMGTLLKTGPTGNNLMDIVLILIETK